MTDTVYGMNFAADGGDAIHFPTYTTTQNRLQIDLNNPAPLFDLIKIPAGTNFSVDLGQVQQDSEQLYIVNHNLGYIPQVYVVFLLLPTTSSSTGALTVGAYSFGEMLIAEGGSSTDIINYAINSQTLTINHIVTSDGTDPGFSYTSPANQYLIQIKYLICNNPAIQTISIN